MIEIKNDIFRRIGFTVVFLIVVMCGSIILILPFKLLEDIIGNYIIVVLLIFVIIMIQFLYKC